jgi:hypothetical protein
MLQAPNDVAVETNLLRKALFRTGREHGAIDTSDLLGTSRASEPLRLLDVDVLGWLGGQVLAGQRTVDFSRAQLARHLYRRAPGGADRAAIAASLDRLVSAELTFGGFDATTGDHAALAFERVHLLRTVTPARRSRSGQPLTWRAEFEPWYLNQLGMGYVTFIDWRTSRRLRGAAKRLWLYACAERWRPNDEPGFIILSPKGLAALALDYKEVKHALHALRGACAAVENADPRLRFSVQQEGRYPRLLIWRSRAGMHDRARAWPGLDPSTLYVGSIRAGWRKRDRISSPTSSSVLGALRQSVEPDDEDEARGWAEAAEPGTRDDAEGGRLAAIVQAQDGTYALHLDDCVEIALSDLTRAELIAADEPIALRDWWERQRLPWPRPCSTCRPTPLQNLWA